MWSFIFKKNCKKSEYLRRNEHISFWPGVNIIILIDTHMTCMHSTKTVHGSRRKFPFRIRSLPFETVDAISQNGRCHLKRSMPFWQNGRCHLKRSMPFLMTVSWEMASTVSNGNDRLRKGNWRSRHSIVVVLVRFGGDYPCHWLNFQSGLF